MERIKDFVENELKGCKEYCDSREDMIRACSFCLGAIQYAMFIKEVEYTQELTDWWEKIREEFYYGDFKKMLDKSTEE